MRALFDGRAGDPQRTRKADFGPKSAQTRQIFGGSLNGGWRVDQSPHPGGDQRGSGLPAREALFEAVPEADFGLAEAPAEQDGLALPLRGEVDEPLDRGP